MPSTRLGLLRSLSDARTGLAGTLGLALVIAGVMTGKWDVLAGGIGAVIGALGSALNAPSGIGSVIRANPAVQSAYLGESYNDAEPAHC